MTKMAQTIKKFPHTGDTDPLDVFGYKHSVKQIYKTFLSDLENLPVFFNSMRGNPEQNAGTIHKSNPENLLVFKAPFGDNPQVQS